MRGSRLSQVFAKTAAALLSPAGPRARLAVFSYHQVLDRKDPLRPAEPDRSDFRDDVEVIGRTFTVLPLAEAAQRMADGTLPARAACVTFDDGYANNHAFAAPILEAASVPATFFVAAGAVDDGVMWNDLVIEAMARCPRPTFEGVPGIDPRSVAGASGAALVASLLEQLKYRPLEERLCSARQIYVVNAGGEPPRLMMDRAMVADLARRGFDVGGHTVRHPILKQLPDDDARREIEACAEWIETVTGRRPRTFAYPNGRPGTDFVASHAEMVAAAGYVAAVSTAWDLARRGTDRFSIPRVGPWWRQGRTLPDGLLRIYSKSYLS